MAAHADALSSSNVEEVGNILQSGHALSQQELNSALLTAVSRAEQSDTVAKLLSHGAQITTGAIGFAARRGDVIAFRAFVDHGWDINSLEFGQPTLR
jgi:hypothetical protein